MNGDERVAGIHQVVVNKKVEKRPERTVVWTKQIQLSSRPEDPNTGKLLAFWFSGIFG